MTDDVLRKIEELGSAVRERKLSDAELQRLEARLTDLKDQVETVKPRRSILELKGLGKDYWRSINVEEYLREERNSWD